MRLGCCADGGSAASGRSAGRAGRGANWLALVGFHLIGRYPTFLQEERQIDPAPRLFNLLPMVSVLEFLQQLNDKPERESQSEGH